MSDYENSVFTNLPRRKLVDGERGADAFNRGFREAIGMYQPEGPLPPRPRPSGKGGPSIGQGVKPPPVTSVWSAADAAANSMTLSNGGLTVAGLSTNVWQSIRTTLSHTSGKVYVEFFCNVSDATVVFGLADAGFVPTSYLGSSPHSAGIYNGANQVSAGFTSNYTPAQIPNTNDVWGLAINFTAGSVWIAQNNVWVNSSNPATGSLPVLSFVPATVGALFAGVSINSNRDTITLQPTAASQKYAPPAGFTAWG